MRSAVGWGVALVAALVGSPPQRAAAQQTEPDTAAAARVGAAVHLGNFTVAAGTVQPGDVTVVGGDLRVKGRISGNAVVVNGQLILEPNGLVLGDAVVTGGRIVESGGRVRGDMRSVAAPTNVTPEAHAPAAAAAPQSRPRVRVDVNVDAADGTQRRGSGWLRRVTSALAGAASVVALAMLLAGAGGALVFYARFYLKNVSETVRASVLRSAGAGFAAGFLILPAFLVLLVALLVSLVGIPLLLVAVPLYPAAVVAALGFGLLAVAHAIGEYTAERKHSLEPRHRNSYAYLFSGLVLLFAPAVAGYLLEMAPFLGFIGVLVRFLALAAICAAATVGFGAVILSRGGQRAPTAGATEPDPSPDPWLEEDLFRNESDA